MFTVIITGMLNCVEEIRLDLEVTELDSLKGVKLVWHNNVRLRLVGEYNPANHRVIWTGEAQH